MVGEQRDGKRKQEMRREGKRRESEGREGKESEGRKGRGGKSTVKQHHRDTMGSSAPSTSDIELFCSVEKHNRERYARRSTGW